MAISFLVKRHKVQGCRIFYVRRPEFETREDKIAFLGNAELSGLEFEEIRPDGKHNWINLTQNDFGSLLPIATKEVKATRKASQERAIFKLFSLGVVTNRDEWVYDHDRRQLADKVGMFIDRYEAERVRWGKQGQPGATADWVERDIKWTSELEAYLRRNTSLRFKNERIRASCYRPFTTVWTYYDRVITHRVYQQDSIFPIESNWPNTCITITDPTGMKPWLVSAVSNLPDLHYVGAAAGTVCLPRSRHENGEVLENITDWSLEQFRKHYQPGRAKAKRPITKEGIFHYVYGVLHDPIYREKYAINLKREFPRVPFYADFWRWSDWGEELLKLHISYESVTPAKLKRIDIPDDGARKSGVAPKALLKTDKEGGRILIDGETTLSGIPAEAWQYRLGNRTALEWVLDQHKERKPKDPTIREKFDTYRFTEYKEKVIDLLARVATVSVRTVAIVEEMRRAAR